MDIRVDGTSNFVFLVNSGPQTQTGPIVSLWGKDIFFFFFFQKMYDVFRFVLNRRNQDN